MRPDILGWRAERAIREGSEYHCLRCNKAFRAGTRNLSCAVNHGQEGCCHYTDTEIKPFDPELIPIDGEDEKG